MRKATQEVTANTLSQFTIKPRDSLRVERAESNGRVQLRIRHPRRTCPYCRSEIGSEERRSCPACAADYHEACASELRGCATFGCRGRPRAPGASEGMSEEAALMVALVALLLSLSVGGFCYGTPLGIAWGAALLAMVPVALIMAWA